MLPATCYIRIRNRCKPFSSSKLNPFPFWLNVIYSAARFQCTIRYQSLNMLIFQLTGHILTLQSVQSYENKGGCAKTRHISTIMINGMENMGNYKSKRQVLYEI